MQRVINVLAVTSFLVTATTVAGGIYVYTNKDSIIESVKENIMGELLPGELPGDLNSIPSVGETPTLSIPQF